jgi:hypothetical protein
MRSRDLLAVALLVLAAGGCTVFDETVVVAVSTLVPSLTDSDLSSQPVEVGVFLEGGTIQNIHFKDVSVLDLTFDEFTSDITFGEECQFFRAWNTPIFALGKCASGLVVDGDEQEHVMTLEVTIGEIWVQRVPPLVLLPSHDYDADGVDNANDNCLLIDNPDQTDTGAKGYGDVCAVFDFGSGIPRLDSDGDSIADSSDNCPYTQNPGQEDSGIDLGQPLSFPDGIGDACETQTAAVKLNGSTLIQLSLGPLTAVTPLRRVRWLIADFRDETALDPCWEGGSCELDASQILFCLDENGGFGCPL